jgi:hypothetical protein
MVSVLGCEFHDTKPSILVIAIDSMPYDSILCNDTHRDAGFQNVCDEMARFTHAFTPSILGQSAMASLLTGLYPFDHGVRHNGDDAIPAYIETVAEVAVKNHYRTSFFSGGVPIFRKSGIQQGFEVFDDNIGIDKDRYYRPVMENFSTFLKWAKESRDPFLSFIYLPDLQFPEFSTIDREGLARERSPVGQLSEIGESVDFLIREMKSKRIWNSTWVFVVGLNGVASESRKKELPGTNLFFENTRVTLCIIGRGGTHAASRHRWDDAIQCWIDLLLLPLRRPFLAK